MDILFGFALGWVLSRECEPLFIKLWAMWWRLNVVPQGAGYAFVTIRGLTGFSVMLAPNDMVNLKAFRRAVTGPAIAFIDAEKRAAEAAPSAGRF